MSNYKRNPISIQGFRDIAKGDIKSNVAMCDHTNQHAAKVPVDVGGQAGALVCAAHCNERNASGKACQTFTFISEGPTKGLCVMHNQRLKCGVKGANRNVPSNMFPFIPDAGANADGWEPTMSPPPEAARFQKPGMVVAPGPGSGPGPGPSPGQPPPSPGQPAPPPRQPVPAPGGGGAVVVPAPSRGTGALLGGGSGSASAGYGAASGNSSMFGLLIMLLVVALIVGGVFFLHKKTGILSKVGVPAIGSGGKKKKK